MSRIFDQAVENIGRKYLQGVPVSALAEEYGMPESWIREIVEEYEYSESDLDESMDGDFDSAMASAGFGTDEDYGYYGDSEY